MFIEKRIIKTDRVEQVMSSVDRLKYRGEYFDSPLGIGRLLKSPGVSCTKFLRSWTNYQCSSYARYVFGNIESSY